MESWLKKELEKPITQFRIKLMAVKNPAPEAASGLLTAYAAECKISPDAIAGAVAWLESGKLPERVNLSTPETQAAWGFAMLADARREPENQTWRAIVKEPRLAQEASMLGTLLLSTVQAPQSTIAWGRPGSWFYQDPVRNHINIDPATAMVLGLQNSRSVVLHEIGHSDITHGRSPKIVALIDKMKAIENKYKTPEGKIDIPEEESIEMQKLAREYSLRETVWQHGEDAAVNTYSEIEGANYPTDVKLGFFRTYIAVSISRALAEKNNPMKELMEALQKMMETIHLGREKTPEELEAEKKAKEIENTIELQVKAGSLAYPITRGWMDVEDPTEWETVDTKKTPETEAIVEAFAGKDGLGNIQPSLQASRMQLFSGLKTEISKSCQDERNRRIDEVFDQFYKPLLDQLPLPPKMGFSYEPGDKEPENEEPEEADPKTLKDCAIEQENSEKAQRAEREKAEQNQKNAIRQSMGSKSPLDRLPENLTGYEDAVEKCQEQIQMVTGIIKGIKKNQEVPGRKVPTLLPEAGVSTFDVHKYERYQEKIDAGKRLSQPDYEFFKKKNKDEAPATTHLVFYIDGSGSMGGRGTKLSMTTLVIFQEAARRAKNVTVTALYSGAEKTELLLNGITPTEQQKKVIGGMLESGHARGDNEICAAGLNEMLTAIDAAMDLKHTNGNIHVLAITDGGTCVYKEEEIVRSLEAVINISKSLSVDTLQLGMYESPFEKANKKIKPRNPKQTPELCKIDGMETIAKEATRILTGRFRQMKSFSPETTKGFQKKASVAKRTLSKLDKEDRRGIME